MDFDFTIDVFDGEVPEETKTKAKRLLKKKNDQDSLFDKENIQKNENPGLLEFSSSDFSGVDYSDEEINGKENTFIQNNSYYGNEDYEAFSLESKESHSGLQQKSGSEQDNWYTEDLSSVDDGYDIEENNQFDFNSELKQDLQATIPLNYDLESEEVFSNSFKIKNTDIIKGEDSKEAEELEPTMAMYYGMESENDLGSMAIDNRFEALAEQEESFLGFSDNSNDENVFSNTCDSEDTFDVSQKVKKQHKNVSKSDSSSEGSSGSKILLGVMIAFITVLLVILVLEILYFTGVTQSFIPTQELRGLFGKENIVEQYAGEPLTTENYYSGYETENNLIYGDEHYYYEEPEIITTTVPETTQPEEILSVPQELQRYSYSIEKVDRVFIVATKGDNLNVRAEPSTSSDVVEMIPKDTAVFVEYEYEGWAYLQYNNTYGWCSMDYLM